MENKAWAIGWDRNLQRPDGACTITGQVFLYILEGMGSYLHQQQA